MVLTGSPAVRPRSEHQTRVLLISDGIPGHFRQAEGVVAALARRRPLQVTRLDLPPLSPLGRLALNRVAPYWPGLFTDTILFAGADLPPGPFDLVVSAGGRTLAANVRAARRYSAPNVFSGSPRRFGYGAFARVLQIYPMSDPPPSYRLVVKPSPVDPDAAPAPRPLAERSPERPATIGVLVGGPVPHADFAEADWAALAALLRTLAATEPVRFVIATSRRTPDIALRHIEPVARDHAVTLDYVDYRTSGPGSIVRALATDALLVTADSMSMIFEAATMRRPVLVLRPAVTKPARDDAALAVLLGEGAVAGLPLGDATPDAVMSGLISRTPYAQNPLDRLADVIEDLLPPATGGAP